MTDMPQNRFDFDYYCPRKWLIGVDEAGRGPLAGPVVAAATGLRCSSQHDFHLLQDYFQTLGIGDSKKLSSKQRRKIVTTLGIEFHGLQLETPYVCFRDERVIISLSLRSPEFIDQHNILYSALRSMESAVIGLNCSIETECSYLLIDGDKCPGQWPKKEVALIKGDERSLLIGLSSIVAKEYRDHLMVEYDQIYPEYGLAKHSGYPTPSHQKALEQYGPSPIHRRSFRGVLQ